MTLTAISGMIVVCVRRPHLIKSVLRFLPNLVVITGIVFKRKLWKRFPSSLFKSGYLQVWTEMI